MSYLCETLLKASIRSRLSIDIIQPDFAHYIVYRHDVNRFIAKSVERSFHALI